MNWLTVADRKVTLLVNKNLVNLVPIAAETKNAVDGLVTQARKNEIYLWLSPPDPSINLQRGLQLRNGKSGTWMLQSKAYTSWKTTEKSFLWVNGKPGCGKTVLTSTIIADLQKSEQDIQTLLYFYFDFNSRDQRSWEKMIRSLLYQIYCNKPGTRGILDSLFSSCHDGASQPYFESLCESFESMIKHSSPAWIVLDALDECERQALCSEDDILKWIAGLVGSQTDVRLLVASRPEPEIKSVFETFARKKHIVALDSDVVEEDIRRYIQSTVRQHVALKRWRERPDIQEEIEMALIGKADGM